MLTEGEVLSQAKVRSRFRLLHGQEMVKRNRTAAPGASSPSLFPLIATVRVLAMIFSHSESRLHISSQQTDLLTTWFSRLAPQCGLIESEWPSVVFFCVVVLVDDQLQPPEAAAHCGTGY
jgi:hypothetical protein